MGQRLVIKIKYDNKDLACAYYHWSGYTRSSQHLTNEVIDTYNELIYDERIYNMTFHNIYMKAVLMLQGSGAGVQEDELNAINNNIAFNKELLNEGQNRTDGLIYVTPEQIEYTVGWAEALVEIDIKSETVAFGASICESKKEFIENLRDWTECSLEEAEKKYNEIPEALEKLASPGISFSDFQNLPILTDEYPYGIKDEDGYVYTWVE